jgi:hypothetical protein
MFSLSIPIETFFQKSTSYTMLLWYRKIRNNVECQQISMGQPSCTNHCSVDILRWVDFDHKGFTTSTKGEGV